MPIAAAIFHFLGAFALVSALTAEMILISSELNERTARKLLIADTILGIAAASLVIFGSLRLMYYEKGAAYYMHSAPFIAKLLLFAVAASISGYPTYQYLTLRKAMKQGLAPVLPPGKIRRIKGALHAQLLAVVIVIICASLTAKGVGIFGGQPSAASVAVL